MALCATLLLFRKLATRYEPDVFVRRVSRLIASLGSLGVVSLTGCAEATEPPPVIATVAPIPADADLVFVLAQGFDMDTGALLHVRPDQIGLAGLDVEPGAVAMLVTFTAGMDIEHVAASPDRASLVFNRNQHGEFGPGSVRSELWRLDLRDGRLTRLGETFFSAGQGGVDWSAVGYIYFSGLERRPTPIRPVGSDIFRIRVDGAGLENLTHTLDRFEADVQLSLDGAQIAYNAGVRDTPGPQVELWVRDANGENPRLVLTTQADRRDSAHDPD